MTKVCSKCKKDFHCHASNIGKCWCVKIKVTEGTLEKINKNYSGCICKKCFIKIISANPIP